MRTLRWQINSILSQFDWLEIIRKRTCGAKTRRGTPCKIKTDTYRCKNGKWRCRYHGGLSTGPKTPEGKARSGLGLKEWHKRQRA